MEKISREKKSSSLTNIVVIIVIVVGAIIGLIVWLSPSNTIDPPPVTPTSQTSNTYDVVTPNWSEVKEIFEGYDKEITSLIPNFTSTTDTTYSVKNTSTEGEDGWSITTKLDNTQEEDIKNYEDELINNDFEQTQDHEYLTPVLDKPYDLYVVLQTEQEIPYVVTITYICIPKDTITSWPLSTLVRNFGYAKAMSIPTVTTATNYEVTREDKTEVNINLTTTTPSTIYDNYISALTSKQYYLDNSTYIKPTSGLKFSLTHNVNVTINIKSVPTWVPLDPSPTDPTPTDPTTPDLDYVNWATLISSLSNYTKYSLPSIVPEYVGNNQLNFTSRSISVDNYGSKFKYGITATNTTEGEASTYKDSLTTRGYVYDTTSTSYIFTNDYYTIHVEVNYNNNQTQINIFGVAKPRSPWHTVNMEFLKGELGHSDIDEIIKPYQAVTAEYSQKHDSRTEDTRGVVISVIHTSEEELNDWISSLVNFESVDDYYINTSKYEYDDIRISVSYDNLTSTAILHVEQIRTEFYWDDIIINVNEEIPNLDITKIPHLDKVLHDYRQVTLTDSSGTYVQVTVTGLSIEDCNDYRAVLVSNGYKYRSNAYRYENDIVISIERPISDRPYITIIKIGIENTASLIEGNYFYTDGTDIKKVTYEAGTFSVYTYNMNNATATLDYAKSYTVANNKVTGPEDRELEILSSVNLGNRLFKVDGNPYLVGSSLIGFPLVDGTAGVYYPVVQNSPIPSSISHNGDTRIVSTVMPNALKNMTINNRLIANNIINIGVNAFEGTKFAKASGGLIPIVIPSSVKFIGSNAFMGADITSLTFDNLANVRYIGDEAFSYNAIADEPNLSIVPYVGKDVYGNISGTFYKYDYGYRTLHRYVFNKITKTYTWDKRTINLNGEWSSEWTASTESNLTFTPGKQVTIKYSKATNNEEDTFKVIDNTNLNDEYYMVNEEPEIIDGVLYMDTNSRGVGIAFVKVIEGNVIPREYKNKPVEMILRQGMFTQGAEQHIFVPKSIKYIGSFAFNYGNITSVEFEDESELEILDSYALYGSRIEEIVIPNKVKYIGQRALDVNELSNVTFAPDSIIETIEEGVFGGMALTEITLPKTLKTFLAGYDILGLQTINIQEGSPYFKVENNIVLSMDGKEVWFGNVDESSTDLVIPEGVEIIHENAFFDSKKTTVSFPSTLKVIETEAFRANKFTTITIPASVIYIGDSAFYIRYDSTTKITTLIFEENSHLEFIGRYAFAGSDISNLVLPESVITYTDAFIN